MKKGILIPLLIFTGLITLFLAQKTYAGTLYQQTTGDTLSEDFEAPCTAGQECFLIEQFAASSTLVADTEFTLYLKATEDVDILHSSINLGVYSPTDTWASFNKVQVAGNTPYASWSYDAETDILTITASSSFWTAWNDAWDMPNTILLFNNDGEVNYYGSASDNYPGYETRWYNGSGNFTKSPDTNIHDLYFRITGEVEPTIAIEYPANESITADFLNFILAIQSELEGDFPLSPVLQARMCYGTSQAYVGDCPSYSESYPDLIIDYNNYANPTPGIPILRSLQKSQPLASSTTYYGKAYLYDIYGTYLTASPEMSWTIGSSTIMSMENVSSTLGMSTDWNSLLNLIKTKPPLGYIFILQNAWQGLDSSSTAAVQLPYLASVQNYVFDPLRTGFIFILWLEWGVIYFHRFKHIEL